jgi:pimeloyl-ACP methyl ester carboxylesterase
VRFTLSISRREFATCSVPALGGFLLAGPVQPVRAEKHHGNPTAVCPGEAWRTLPATPTLPPPQASEFVHSQGVDIYFAEFGEGPAVVFLHGGLANANYWAGIVAVLRHRCKAVLMDFRGHGRSTMGTEEISYALLASDVIALLDKLQLPRAPLIGWSDGGIVGLTLAMRHPERVSALFAFGANYNHDGVRSGGGGSETFRLYEQRCALEYQKLSPHPQQFGQLRSAMARMWRNEPNYSTRDLAGIGVPTTIADGQFDEIISLRHTQSMAAAIPSAQLFIQPCVSHFGLLQDPGAFAQSVASALSPILQ